MWHQCGEAITHWLLKAGAEPVGASLVVIKARHTAEPQCPHINGERQQYKKPPVLTVYLALLKNPFAVETGLLQTFGFKD